MKDTPELQRQAADLLATFRQRLLRSEVSQLDLPHHHLNSNVRWTKLASHATSILAAILKDGLLREDGKPPVWVRRSLKETLTGPEREDLFRPSRTAIRQRFLLLVFLRKLLGAMKQRINRELADLQPLSQEDEDDLLRTVEDLYGRAISDDEALQLLYPRAGGCTHHRKRIYYNGGFTTTVCGACKKVLHHDDRTEKPNAPQAHRCRGQWIPGKEGKEARCVDPDCQRTISNPERFNWQECGLEPYGDDPEKDEIIRLQEVME